MGALARFFLQAKEKGRVGESVSDFVFIFAHTHIKVTYGMGEHHRYADFTGV